MGFRLSAEDVDERRRAEYWHATVLSTIGRSEVVHTSPVGARCHVEVRRAGGLVLVDSSSTPLEFRRTERDIRGDERDFLSIGLLRHGTGFSEQDGRRVRRRPGTIGVVDYTRPYATTYDTDHTILGIGVPRERLERAFGSSKRFTALTIDEAVGSAPIAAFLTSLFDNAEHMAPGVAAEMADVGIELVMGGLARRLAMEPALPQSAALQLHRAQSFITANLADPALNPAMVATALGISLRHLQALFHRRQTTPSDWIWRRRLVRARERLASPGFATVSVAEVAYGSGFVDQGHFSRRFKAEFGLSPRDWRQRSLAAGREAVAQ